MRLADSAGLCLCLLLAAAPVAPATCDPTTDPDKTDIANARAAVAGNCDCTAATSHGAYVSCATTQANNVLVNKGCAGFVKKCAAHSTCGKRAGAVTCCVTKTTGTKCKIKRDAVHCTAPAGATACVGTYTSCCDACSAGGCASTTTTTTSTMSSTTTTCPAATPNYCPTTGECLAPCPIGRTTFKPTTCACEGNFCNWTCSSGVAGCLDQSSTCTDYCFAACGDYCHSIGDYCAVAACEPDCEDNLCNGRCSGDPPGLCVRLSNCTDECTTAACDSACSARGLTCAFQPSCGSGCYP
jgi:hypothetical protein